MSRMNISWGRESEFAYHHLEDSTITRVAAEVDDARHKYSWMGGAISQIRYWEDVKTPPPKKLGIAPSKSGSGPANTDWLAGLTMWQHKRRQRPQIF